MRTPLAPALMVRWMVCLIALRNAMRRSSCEATFCATRTASSSGCRTSLISSLTFLSVCLPIEVRSSSTLAPPLPMTIPGLAEWTVTVTWLTPRSISTWLTLALASCLATSCRIRMSSCSKVA